MGRLVAGMLCLGTFYIWDVSKLGRFVLGRFVGVPLLCFWEPEVSVEDGLRWRERVEDGGM